MTTIRSLIKRKGGTQITLDATKYHFTDRDETGEHIADVTNEDHVARFLAIPEGYRLHSTTAAAAIAPAAQGDETTGTADDDEGPMDEGEDAIYAILDDGDTSRATLIKALTFLNGEAPAKGAKTQDLLTEFHATAIQRGYDAAEDDTKE